MLFSKRQSTSQQTFSGSIKSDFPSAADANVVNRVSGGVYFYAELLDKCRFQCYIK